MSARQTYGSGRQDGFSTGGASTLRGGHIARVTPGSPAARAGLRESDRILAAEGRPLTDIIAWWWEAEGERVSLSVLPGASDTDRADVREMTLARASGEPWGIEFTGTIFDGVRTCANRCAFCFMAQLPPGLRTALYVRDDDYRLSFLDGNFITLTNLTDEDVARIVSERLSPLYVSLHAVSASVRERLICAREDRALERFDQLLDGGIDLHVQLVLVPGVNDGEELERTLHWLAEREGVPSIGVVPLGYTAHQERYTASYEHPDDAAAVLDALAPWTSAMRERDGIGWVYAADEFYVNAGREIPSAEEYDGFPQYENGIGLVRTFLDDFEARVGEVGPEDPGARPTSVAARTPLLHGSPPDRVVAVTGAMFAPILAAAIQRTGLEDRVSVLAVKNRFFDGNVSVTGLLAGADIVEALAEARTSLDPALAQAVAHGTVLLPEVVFNDDGLTLDDMTAGQIASAASVSLSVIDPDADGLLSGIL